MINKENTPQLGGYMKRIVVSVIVSTCVLMILFSGVVAKYLYIQAPVIMAEEVKVTSPSVMEQVPLIPLEKAQEVTQKITTESTVQTQQELILDDTIKKNKQITLSAVGDCTLGYYKGQNEWNRFDQIAEQNGLDYFMKNVREIFEQDDLTIINLEGPLTVASYGAEKQFVMRGDPKYIEILTGSSIEAASLANNHTYDCGDKGYQETRQLLEDNGVGAFGNEQIHYEDIEGIKVALIGYKAWDAGKNTKEAVKKLIDKAKEQAELVIIMFHWGQESSNLPNEAQKQLGKFAIDCGVDLVLGSHPHVIQGIEEYQGKNIVYSLGNFSFGGNRNPKDKDTFIYQETFELQEGKVVSIGSKVIPCTISSVTDRNNYQPKVSEDPSKILKRLEKYSEVFEISYFK